LVKKGEVLMGQPAVGFRRRHLTLIPDPEADRPAPWRRIVSEVQATIALLQPELARTIHRGRLRLGEVLRDWLAPPDRERVRRPRW
jgi:hypothetical protein